MMCVKIKKKELYLIRETHIHISYPISFFFFISIWNYSKIMSNLSEFICIKRACPVIYTCIYIYIIDITQLNKEMDHHLNWQLFHFHFHFHSLLHHICFNGPIQSSLISTHLLSALTLSPLPSYSLSLSLLSSGGGVVLFETEEGR